MSTEFTKTVRGASLLERIFIRSMVVLLKIEGNCSCLRAKVAHMVGHLPRGQWSERVTLLQNLGQQVWWGEMPVLPVLWHGARDLAGKYAV